MKDLNEYFRPGSPEEAVKIKKSFGAEAIYLAGGSDILVHRPDRVRAVIDVRRVGMDAIEERDGTVFIGGAALLRDVEGLSRVGRGLLREAARETAPWLVRNAATLAGNIANASPAADAVPALLALDAELLLLGDGDSSVALREILVGPHRTSLGNRLIRWISIPASAAARPGAFIKLSRSKSDIAQVNVAVSFRIKAGAARDVRIALGAVAPTAIRAFSAERTLEGQEPRGKVLADVVAAVGDEVRPISDWRASEEYRRRMCEVLVRRAIERVADGEKPN